jgi:hypothetical protein
MTTTISKLFDDHATASRAVAELEAAGVSRSEISVVASNADNWYDAGDRHTGITTTTTARVDRDADGVDDRAEGAGAGAGVGAAVGGEPPRVCRRPFRLSHAAIAGRSSTA